MYKKIMVPLDGSKLAECVLPHVESIAQGCGSPTIVLVSVVDISAMPTISEPSTVAAEEHLELIREQVEAQEAARGETYLDNVISRSGLGSATVTKEILQGRPAETLSDYAKNNEVDLIIIATHGRSGISRWVWGSVADKILRSACVPVLMVRPAGCVPGI